MGIFNDGPRLLFNLYGIYTRKRLINDLGRIPETAEYIGLEIYHLRIYKFHKYKKAKRKRRESKFRLIQQTEVPRHPNTDEFHNGELGNRIN